MKGVFLSLCVYSLLVVSVASRTTTVFAQERQMGGLGITVFTDRNFHGKSATYREEIPDLEPLGLYDKISSLRVAQGERWEICEHSNYQGRCVVVSGNEPDLRKPPGTILFLQCEEWMGGRVLLRPRATAT